MDEWWSGTALKGRQSGEEEKRSEKKRGEERREDKLEIFIR